jgi:polysaccharide biosynthesis/export protein ExoF
MQLGEGTTMAMKNALKYTSLAIASLGFGVLTLPHVQSPVLADEKPSAVPVEANQAAPLQIQTSQASDTPVAEGDCKPASASGGAGDGATKIRRGDKVKLAFYESLQSQDDKWGADRKRIQPSSKSFQLRSELSNEYFVQDDGSISIPLLGVFSVDGRKSADVQRQLECSFESVFGRSGFVNVLSVVNQPIYIVGKVKNAGSYAFTAGMTVMHAVALAGGFDKAPIEAFQVAELAREANRLQMSLGRAMRMMARTSAVEAARTQGLPTVSTELAELAGKQRAAALVEQEFSTRQAEMQAVVADEASLMSAVESASAELNLKKAQLPLVEQAISMRRERVENLTRLAASGSIARPVLIQAQSELLDAEARRHESQVIINQANERLNRARRDIQTRHEQAAIAMKKDLAEAHTEAAVSAEESDSAANVINVMAKTELASAATLETEFLVIRRVGDRVVEIPCGATMLLEPGDLVQTQNALYGPGKSTSR